MYNRYTFPLVVLAVGAFLFVALFTFNPVSVNNDNSNINTDELLQEEKQPSYLFTHSTEEGGFEKLEGDEYVLTLSEPDKNVIYFSDRPFRETGQEKLGIFLDTLGFEIGEAPNAVIVVESKSGEKTMIVAELVEPIWNRDEDTLIYKAIILRNETGELAQYGEEVSIPENFASATFFIDSSKYHNKKKDYKEKTCGEKHHKMTLNEAYKIAKGDRGGDTECLMHSADFDEVDFECKDNVWKVKMNTNIKGEASKCQAYCIVLPEEKYKKGEGVARIEYDCKYHGDEKGDKNVFCPQPKVKNGHYYEDVANDLIDEYHRIAKKAKEGHTSYEHHYCVQTGMPYSTNKHWATDCSGLGGYALFKKLPYHYKLLDESRDAHAKADRPLAMDFYNFIHDLKDDNKCWERIHKLENAKQGDFLVVKYHKHDDHKKNCTSSTGHVMWIDEVHNKTGSHRKITVIDSANSGHGGDTRKDKNTYNCEGDRDCGIGKGDMWFYTNDKGHPVKYTWKAHPGQNTHYCRYDAKDCDCKKSCSDDASDKCELEGIVIGRVKDCKAK